MRRTVQPVGRGDRILYRGWAPYAFLSPYLLLTSLFFLVPFVNAIALAFYETNGPRARVFVGLANFRFSAFPTRCSIGRSKNTTIFAFASVFLQLPLSLGLALLLNSGGGRARGFFRLLLFSPNLVGQIFVGISVRSCSPRGMGSSTGPFKRSSTGGSKSAG